MRVVEKVKSSAAFGATPQRGRGGLGSGTPAAGTERGPCVRGDGYATRNPQLLSVVGTSRERRWPHVRRSWRSWAFWRAGSRSWGDHPAVAAGTGLGDRRERHDVAQPQRRGPGEISPSLPRAITWLRARPMASLLVMLMRFSFEG